MRAGERLTALFAKPWTDSQVLATVLTEPGLGAFRDAVTAHVQAFGDRTLHELKLETPTLGDEPQQVIGQLRGLLASDRSLDALERREAEVRAAAEGRVAAALGGPKAWALGFVLKHTRASVRFREDLRLARSRAFGMVKRIFRRLGRLLAEAKLLPAADDVFLLTVEEVVGTVRGCATTRNLGALVELRRAEQEDHRLSDPTPRVRTRGIVYALPFSQVRVPATARDLVGMGCAPGRVRARARVVHDPAAAEPVAGEILVARQTDPGWVFLMVTAAGLVVERGSLLSHTAIIGRELGIPTVVGVPGATSRIRTGDLVKLDGEAGTVRLVTDPGGDAGEEAPAATAPAKPAAPAEPAADAKPADADAADAKPADTDAKPADTDAADAKPTASSDAASGDGA